jgi:hypothetical protein
VSDDTPVQYGCHFCGALGPMPHRETCPNHPDSPARRCAEPGCTHLLTRQLRATGRCSQHQHGVRSESCAVLGCSGRRASRFSHYCATHRALNARTRAFQPMTVCEHANEVRAGGCTCPPDCGCREHMCHWTAEPRGGNNPLCRCGHRLECHAPDMDGSGECAHGWTLGTRQQRPRWRRYSPGPRACSCPGFHAASNPALRPAPCDCGHGIEQHVGPEGSSVSGMMTACREACPCRGYHRAALVAAPRVRPATGPLAAMFCEDCGHSMTMHLNDRNQCLFQSPRMGAPCGCSPDSLPNEPREPSRERAIRVRD